MLSRQLYCKRVDGKGDSSQPTTNPSTQQVDKLNSDQSTWKTGCEFDPSELKELRTLHYP